MTSIPWLQEIFSKNGYDFFLRFFAKNVFFLQSNKKYDRMFRIYFINYKYWVSGEVWYSWESFSANVHAKTDLRNYVTVWWEVKWKMSVSKNTDMLAWLSWEATVTWKPWNVQSIWWYVQAWVWVESQLDNWWKVEAWFVAWFVPWTTLTTGWVKDQIWWAWLGMESTTLHGRYTAPSWNSVYWKVWKTWSNLWEWNSGDILEVWWTTKLWKNIALDASVSLWEGNETANVWVTFNLDWKWNDSGKAYRNPS